MGRPSMRSTFGGRAPHGSGGGHGHGHGGPPAGPSPEAIKAGHEVGEISIKPLVNFLIGLVVLSAASLAASYAVFLFLANYKSRTVEKPTPMQVLQQGQKPPLPRLQVNPLKDWLDFKAEQDSVLTTYGWVDKEHGVVRLPVDRALEIMAERPWPHAAGEYRPPGVAARSAEGASGEAQDPHAGGGHQ